MSLVAVQQIRRMRGGAQAQMMLADDGNLYVVKFQNNPQHLRVLANEWFATRLARAVGLTVPSCEVIEVSDDLIASTPELEMATGASRERCKAGIHFGSFFVGGLVQDYLPNEMLADVTNLNEFPGMLAFDKWTGNTDGRQAVFSKRIREANYTATFIDQGYCFNAGAWKFNDAALRGVYARKLVYHRVTGWESFEPWLERMENMSPKVVREIARSIPPEWYRGDEEALKIMVESLLARRERIRELIDDFRTFSVESFPDWMRGDVEVSVSRVVDKARMEYLGWNKLHTASSVTADFVKVG